MKLANTTAPTQKQPKKLSKIQILANALLAGEQVTGLQIVNKYNRSDYKTVIWELRDKRNMDITTVMDKHNDGLHGRYFMTEENINAYNNRVEGV